MLSAPYPRTPLDFLRRRGCVVFRPGALFRFRRFAPRCLCGDVTLLLQRLFPRFSRPFASGRFRPVSVRFRRLFRRSGAGCFRPCLLLGSFLLSLRFADWIPLLLYGCGSSLSCCPARWFLVVLLDSLLWLLFIGSWLLMFISDLARASLPGNRADASCSSLGLFLLFIFWTMMLL